jgi:streptogramin lyase
MKMLMKTRRIGIVLCHDVIVRWKRDNMTFPKLFAIITPIIVALILIKATDLSTIAQKLENAAVSENDNAIIHKVFLNNSAHIDTPYIREYSMPNGTWPNSILVARNGLVWTVGIKSHSLICFDPKQGKIISSFPITTNKESSQRVEMVWSIVEDNDGSIWIPQGGSDPLWRFDPHTGKFQVIHSISVAPMQMKVDQKTGNIWFTTFDRGTFGVIQKNDINNDVHGGNNITNTNPEYTVTEFNLGNETFPSGIFLQGDSIWITETLNENKIVEFRPIVDENGRVVNVTKILEIPSSPSYISSSFPSNQQKQLFTTPTDLVVFANDKNSTRPSSIWVAEHGTSFITEYLFDSKTVLRFPTSSSPRHYTTLPYWMAEPRNHKGFWFNEHEGNRITFFNTTAMTMSEYEVPTRDPHNAYLANALTLSADPNDNNKVWFTEFNHDKIGVLDMSTPIPFDINSSPGAITVLSPSISNNEVQKHELAITKVQIITTMNSNNNHFLVFLNASSSMNPMGKFVNMTAKFSPTSVINLTKIRDGGSVIARYTHLILQRDNNTIPIGNYTLGISASDAKVTKSIFLNLLVKQER